jgi:hypothetical protein
MRFKPFYACALIGCLSSTAVADSVSFSDSIPVQLTDWSLSVSIPRFDPLLGTLDSIDFEISGHVEGSVQFESLDSAPSTVMTTLAAVISLQRPDTSVITSVLPAFATSDNLLEFDGNIDFGGDSGRSYFDIVADLMNSHTSPPPVSDLALFTGVGNIILPVTADAASTVSGAGNLVGIISTSAGADVMVTYNYTPIPEPATAFLAFAAAAYMLRYRRSPR